MTRRTGALPVRVIATMNGAIADFGEARLWSETPRFDVRVKTLPRRDGAAGSPSMARP